MGALRSDPVRSAEFRGNRREESRSVRKSRFTEAQIVGILNEQEARNVSTGLRPAVMRIEVSLVG